MKAAVFHGPERPLTIEEIPTPSPGPNEVRVKVAACGVCHTDLHYIDHGTPTFKPPPLVLGHEVSGTIDGAADIDPIVGALQDAVHQDQVVVRCTVQDHARMTAVQHVALDAVVGGVL